MQRPKGLNYRASLRAALGDADEVRVAELANRQERTIDALLTRMYGPDANRREIALLADEVGLGKTFVALGVAWSVLMQRQEAGLAPGPVLVVTPHAHALYNKWGREAERFNSLVAPANGGFEVESVQTPHDLGNALRARKPKLVIARMPALSGRLTQRNTSDLALLHWLFHQPGFELDLDARVRLVSGKDDEFPREALNLNRSTSALEAAEGAWSLGYTEAHIAGAWARLHFTDKWLRGRIAEAFKTAREGGTPKGSLWAALSADRKSRLSHTSVVERWPDQPNPREVMQALARALPFRQHGDVTTPLPKLTILPEVLVPWSATPYLVATCRRFGIGLLAGTYWRPFPPAVRVGWSQTRRFANEALLVLPVEKDAPGFATRVIRVRKPRPAASERGLERALSAAKKPQTWRLLAGDRFFVFRHPTWGSFTVGICSDLLDPLPWALMRGDIAHMFFSAFNEDVDLFGVVTRTRAYEDYCNIVLVNHGSEGGSFAWSPRSGHRKEIARFQGADLDVVADVVLPVASLLEAQENELKRAIARHTDDWDKQPKPREDKFKTPPPGYRNLGRY